MLGLRFCARASSSCGKRGPLPVAVHGPPTIAASPAAEHRLQTRRLSSRGPRAQLLRGMRDPPRPGLEPASPALAGRLSTTAPPGKPPQYHFLKEWKKSTVYRKLCRKSENKISHILTKVNSSLKHNQWRNEKYYVYTCVSFLWCIANYHNLMGSKQYILHSLEVSSLGKH